MRLFDKENHPPFPPMDRQVLYNTHGLLLLFTGIAVALLYRTVQTDKRDLSALWIAVATFCGGFGLLILSTRHGGLVEMLGLLPLSGHASAAARCHRICRTGECPPHAPLGRRRICPWLRPLSCYWIRSTRPRARSHGGTGHGMDPAAQPAQHHAPGKHRHGRVPGDAHRLVLRAHRRHPQPSREHRPAGIRRHVHRRRYRRQLRRDGSAPLAP